MTEKHKRGHDQPKKNTESDDDIIELSDIAIGITPEDDTIVELTEDIIDEAFVGFTGATSELIEGGDERVLDLSENIRAKRNEAMSQPDVADRSEIADSDDIAGSFDDEKDNLEEDITKEIDNYFGTEDTTFSMEDTISIEKSQAAEKSEKSANQFKDQLPVKDQLKEKSGTVPDELQTLQTDDAAHISSAQVDEAIERVVRTMFAEKINRILDEIIERTVTEEISQLKDYLLGIAGKKE